MNSIKEAQCLGHDIWLDYIRRGLINSGEFLGYIEQGISGVTSNPTIFEKAITGSNDYDESLLRLSREKKDNGDIYETLVLQDIEAAADILRPVYDDSKGKHGYASLEVNPKLAYDTEGTVEEGLRLFAALNRPNIMIKVPATVQGIPAIRRLVAEGVNVNVTLLFSLDSYQQSAEAYIAGLEELVQKNADITKIASVASLFISRIDTAVDALLEEHIQPGQEQLKSLYGKAGVATAKLLNQAHKDIFNSERFAKLKSKGALVQRPLWASTGTKNPTYNDLLYVEPLIGPNTINTMPPGTIAAFLDHGKVKAVLDEDIVDARRTFTELKAAGIDIKAVTGILLVKGVKAFIDSFDKLLVGIAEKRGLLTKQAK